MDTLDLVVPLLLIGVVLLTHGATELVGASGMLAPFTAGQVMGNSKFVYRQGMLALVGSADTAAALECAGNAHARMLLVTIASVINSNACRAGPGAVWVTAPGRRAAADVRTGDDRRSRRAQTKGSHMQRTRFSTATILALALVVMSAGCSGNLQRARTLPADAFLERISRHCGQAFEGRIIADVPASANDPFAGKRLIMHVRRCGAREIAIPFHVGDDHSRTWVLTRTRAGLRLKHDHRHADGTPDSVTMYGGGTSTPGTSVRQEFPVDAESIALFEREGLSASVTNTWAMEIEPNRRFLYELSRPGGRLFRVEFDLSRPVAPPPTPWGHE